MSRTHNILALHGFTGCGEDFADFFPLCRSLSSWHCPSLPGHGPNPSLDCSPSATVRWIESARTALCPKPNILLGYSAGARAALLHAVEQTDRWRALILISPNPGIEDPALRIERRSVDRKLAGRIEREGASPFIEFWQRTPMIRSQENIRPDWREKMLRNRQLHTAEGLAASLRGFGQGNCPDLWPKLERLDMPVLLLAGANDQKYCEIMHRMCALLPNAEAHVIPEAGHMPHLEEAESCAAIIDRFIYRVF